MNFINTTDLDNDDLVSSDNDDQPPIGRQYPETPRPTHAETIVDTENPTIYSSTLVVVCIAIAIAHLWTIWTLRTDINIVMEHHKENLQQYTHISTLLQNMQQVQWRMVPAAL
jgi:hypothetical protein|tara:strand:+ start:6522 stop:6860 length:339 start_codon:yes stop_codon:yes gene_type:complete